MARAPRRRHRLLVKVGTDSGLTGRGESCSGADVVSVEAAVKAMAPTGRW